MDVFSSIALAYLVMTALSLVVVVVHVIMNPQPMAVMNAVWPLTVLWSGPVGLVAYFWFGSARRRDLKGSAMQNAQKQAYESDMPKKAGRGSIPKYSSGASTGIGRMAMSNMGADGTSMGSTGNMGAGGTSMGMGETGNVNANATMIAKAKDGMPHEAAPGNDSKMADMDMGSTAGGEMSMEGMDMGSQKPFWQRIASSTFHCGAGCTLADIIGESLGTMLLVACALHGIVAQWILDYILALATGALFQFFAIRPMMRNVSALSVFAKAIKVDFLSLSAWQVGMYTTSGLLLLLAFPGLSHATPAFWFVMQLAMFGGFACSYPMNIFLIKRGIKPAM